MMRKQSAVEEFPPGDYLQEFIDDRGWTQEDLAAILGRPSQVISEIIHDKRRITPDTARGLAQAFGTSAELWLNLDAAWQLYKSRDEQTDSGVTQRARLYSKGPLKEMAKRGWIEMSSNPEVLEQRVLDFYQIKDLEDDPPMLQAAARMSTSYDELTPAQVSWMCRAAQLGRSLTIHREFDKRRIGGLIRQLRMYLLHPQEIRRIPDTLSAFGVRLVIVQHLSTTKIDGACVWLDKKSPVIALSLRHGRIDAFWFTLMHEIGHAARGDEGGKAVTSFLDEQLSDEAPPEGVRPPFEVAADDFAEEALIPQDEMNDFVDRKGPLFSEKDIKGFALLHNVHPGIVVGQLHHRWSKDQRTGVHYSKFRRQLVQVREFIVDSALADGFGRSAPAISP